MMKWISIEDELPNDEDEVLCWSEKFGDPKRSAIGFALILTYEDGCWLREDNSNYESNFDYHMITHWCEITSPNI